MMAAKKKHHHKCPPRRVTRLKASVRTYPRICHMLTIHLQWTLPTTRTDGSPLAPTDIANVTVDDVFANSLHQLPGTAVSFDTGDVTGQSGDHAFNVTVTDVQGNISAPASVTVNVPVAVAAPSPVTGLTGTLVTS